MTLYFENRQPVPAGYFLYHSIGMYPGKEEEFAAAMGEFARVYSAPNDKQWGYMLQRRQDFIDYWRRIIGAPKKTLTTCDSVTQGVHSVVTGMPENWLRGRRVLIAEDCFPSVHFLLTGLAPRLGYTLHTVPKRPGATWVEDDDFLEVWGPDVGLALITWVTSTASYRCDLGRLVTHGRGQGSVIGVDITQAAGLLPFDVGAPRIDFAVSTSLKWMCGTPGAGMIYVDKDLIPEFQPELRGWFSQNNPFSWGLDDFSYAPDIRRFDSGTPASMAAIASVPALRWHAGQDRDAIVRHNRTLVDKIIGHADDLGLPLQSPRDVARRGGTMMLRMPGKAEAGAIVGALGVDGISVDHRDELMRLSPGVLTQSDHVDIAFELIGKVMKTRSRRFAGRQPAHAATPPGQAASDVLANLAGDLVSGRIEVIDCTANLGPETPILRLPKGFAKDTPKVEIHPVTEDKGARSLNWMVLGEHSGTHFDAPHHWLSGKDFPDGFTDTLDVQRLVAPANVIDCAAESAEDDDFLLTVDRVKAWEAEHGEIGPGEWVLMRTDWDRRAHDEELFLNDDPDPLVDGSHSPGPTAECMDYLLTKGIVGWGSQCIGTDAGMAGKFSPPYPAHHHLHRDNCFGLASLANLDRLPPKGAILIAAPLKIERGTGSPIRAIALVPRGVPPRVTE